MRLVRYRRTGWLAAGAMFALGAAACVDEKTVEVEVPRWEEPPAAAVGFMGYSKQDQKLTVCGNCHVTMQSEWLGTGHAKAWQDLAGSGSAQKTCEPCHTTNSLGNEVTVENVGWVATGDKRYYDVQCESCHGPGLEHVSAPDVKQPLARVTVGTDLKFGCGECHTGTHTPFVEEWSKSRHGQLRTSPASRAECQECHEVRGIFKAWNVKADYVEKEKADLIYITCAVCHDPHDARNEGQLRFSISDRTEGGNLCMKCHHKRGIPDPTTFRGPHSPEGPLLIGTGGWRPPGFEYAEQTIVGTHGTERNPKLCATCHVNSFDVTDKAGNFVVHATGHLFEPIPCLDAQGKPQPGDVQCELTQRSFKACTASGCHGTENAARSAFQVARKRIDGLVAQLNAMVAKIPKSEFSTADNRYTTGEGALFNAQMGAMPGSHVHNPFLMEALLTASMKQVTRDYGIQAAPGLVLDNLLTPPLLVTATQ
ncbi:MAG: cytochrome c3 family protein [Gemmatimonadetes bacterium]|nr:cytochrome c3 family protein [Gemmatimonadota bacterium]